MVKFSMIQGAMFGFEIDWQYGWFAIDFGIIRMVIYYNNKGNA